MSHTALYRKWRSGTFEEIKGQEPITEALKNQIKSGRIGHAYLFCGTRGTGKTSVAKILARAVNCENPQDGSPCNKCETCKAILRESSMNVVEMDAASNNGVDDIRQIREQVEYPPVDGKYRVYIIDEVHMLSSSAFNAFLKTLEEPPEYVIFILATTEPNKLPITILSRCQRYDFKRIRTEVIAERLREISEAEGIAASGEALHYIARIGDGSMRDSVSLLDQCAAFRFGRRIEYEDALEILGAVDTSVFSELIRALSSEDVTKAMSLLAEVVEQGRELSQFVSDFLLYSRNVLMAKTVKELQGLVDMSRENLMRLREDSELLSMEELLRYIRMLSELSNQLRYAPQKRVLIETVLMKLAYPETDLSREGVSARLSAMERKLSELEKGAGSVLRGETSAGAARSKAEKDEEGGKREAPGVKKEVRLPRAQYEDLQLLKKEWRSIAMQMPGGLLRNTVSSAWVYPNRENTGMTIATGSKAGYNTISKEETLRELERIVAEKYKKDIRFRAELSASEDSGSTVYVMEEDLRKINFRIETVDSSEEYPEDGGLL